jgi:hypothetical protein
VLAGERAADRLAGVPRCGGKHEAIDRSGARAAGGRRDRQSLKAGPIDHHKRESIEAHLAVVFAALAVTHEIEHKTAWSIKKLVQTTRRYRTIAIRAGGHLLTAEEPLPPELRDALALIT